MDRQNWQVIFSMWTVSVSAGKKSCTQCSDREILLHCLNVTYEIYVVTVSKHHATVWHEKIKVMLGVLWRSAASFISKLKPT